MTPSRLRIPAVALPLVIWALLGMGGLRSDEIECESAVAHLQDCCDDFSVSDEYACDFVTGCGETQYTELTLRESRCIQETPCESDAMRALCPRVEARFAGDPEIDPSEEVCP